MYFENTAMELVSGYKNKAQKELDDAYFKLKPPFKVVYRLLVDHSTKTLSYNYTPVGTDNNVFYRLFVNPITNHYQEIVINEWPENMFEWLEKKSEEMIKNFGYETYNRKSFSDFVNGFHLKTNHSVSKEVFKSDVLSKISK